MFASHAKQVFNVNNVNKSNCHNVIEMQPRDLYHINEKISNGNPEPLQQSELHDDHQHILELVDKDVITCVVVFESISSQWYYRILVEGVYLALIFRMPFAWHRVGDS